MLILMSKVHLVRSLYLGRCLFLFLFYLIEKISWHLDSHFCASDVQEALKSEKLRGGNRMETLMYIFLKVAKEVGVNKR